MRKFILAIAPMLLFGISAPASAEIVFSASGSNAAAISPTVDAFRTALGTLNPSVPGSFGSGRREINWDGVPNGSAAPNNLPPNFFNVNSPRGAVLSTPGTGLEVSSTAASGVPVQFSDIDPSYAGLFATFSPERLFTAVGSNVVDVNFFIAGTTTPAFVSGFGAVFTDVDLANTTSISFFGEGNALLGTYFAPVGTAADESLSFLGVLFGDPVISRVRITSGNAALGPGVTQTASRDLVAMDDFIFGEPTAVPEPESWAMLLMGFAAIGLSLRSKQGRALAPNES
jgi:hypothetical protein